MAKQPSIRPWSRMSSLRSVSSEPTASPFGPSPEAESQTRNTSSLQNNGNASKHIKPQPSTLEDKIPVKEKPKTAPVKNITEKPSVNGNDGSLQKVLNKKISGSDSGTEDSGYRGVITIAGENEGAYIEIIQSPKNKSQKVRTARNGVYMNSNVQCVNNSMLLHTSCTHHDPGMHITLSK